MDSKQKSTEEIETLKFDVEFLEQISEQDEDVQEVLLKTLLEEEEELPEKNGMTQKVCGVIHINQPIYYEVEYLKQEDEKALYLEFKIIHVDLFLDAVIEKTTFKLNKTNGNKKAKTKKVD